MTVLDELFTQRLMHMKANPQVGDLAHVKMFDTGYARTGNIQPARVASDPKGGTSTQLYAKRLYLPEWRKEAIEKIQTGSYAYETIPRKSISAGQTED